MSFSLVCMQPQNSYPTSHSHISIPMRGKIEEGRSGGPCDLFALSSLLCLRGDGSLSVSKVQKPPSSFSLLRLGWRRAATSRTQARIGLFTRTAREGMASIPFSFGSQTRVLQTRLQPRARSNVEDESKDLTEEVAMLSGMVDYYRSNYETALRQIRILRKQVYQYELQLGLAPENTTRTPPKPSFKFPERLFPGRRMGKYRWEQDMQEVRIMVPIGEDVAKADVQVSLTGTEGRKLQVEVNGQDLFEDDELSFPVRGDAVYWIFATDQDEAGAERRVIQINLEKSVRYQNWEFGFVSEDAAPDETVTDRCFIDLELGGEQGTKRLVLGLFGNTQPKGDVLGLGGSGSRSIFGSNFSDENLKLRHSRKGMIAMANDGPDSNGSQFYITFRPLPYMDGKYVVFGTIIQDEDSVLSLISRRFGSPSGIPQAPVKIADCGLLPSSTTRSTEAADSESPSS